MQTKFKKTLLAALPMAGLLFTAPAVYAYDGHDYDRGSRSRYERSYDRHDHSDHHRGRGHDHSDHHRGLSQGRGHDHRDHHQGWRQGRGHDHSDHHRNSWGWRDGNRSGDWHRRNNDRDWSWGRSGYNRGYNDDYSGRSWFGW